MLTLKAKYQSPAQAFYDTKKASLGSLPESIDTDM